MYNLFLYKLLIKSKFIVFKYYDALDNSLVVSDFLHNLSLTSPKNIVINTAPHTIIDIVQGRNDFSILNNTLTLNQFWKGNPIPSKTAKKRIFLPKLFPFIFFIWLLTNSLNNPTQQPTPKNITKNVFILSFNINALEIRPSSNKNVNAITIYDYFNVFHLDSLYFDLDSICNFKITKLFIILLFISTIN